MLANKRSTETGEVQHLLLLHADFVYVRLHGTESKYGGSYPPAALKEWSRRINGWRRDGKAVYFYFNNDPEGHAVKNALALKKMLVPNVS
jgi:uncharacterized protein YecE (DUF72 family)